jgi:hypothetical protein
MTPVNVAGLSMRTVAPRTLDHTATTDVGPELLSGVTTESVVGTRPVLVISEAGKRAEHLTIDLQPEIAAGIMGALGIGIGNIEDQQSRIPDAAGQRDGEVGNGHP